MRHIYERTHTLFAPDNFAAQKTSKALFAVIYLWESFFELSTVLLTTLSVVHTLPTSPLGIRE